MLINHQGAGLFSDLCHGFCAFRFTSNLSVVSKPICKSLDFGREANFLNILNVFEKLYKVILTESLYNFMVLDDSFCPH